MDFILDVSSNFCYVLCRLLLCFGVGVVSFIGTMDMVEFMRNNIVSTCITNFTRCTCFSMVISYLVLLVAMQQLVVS